MISFTTGARAYPTVRGGAYVVPGGFGANSGLHNAGLHNAVDKSLQPGMAGIGSIGNVVTAPTSS